MSKTIGARENFRVEVTPRGLGDFGSISVGTGLIYGRGPDAKRRIERDEQERCNEIANAIKRHVDNVYSAEVKFDKGYVCGHCGKDWTEDSTEYNGGCCDADEANNPNPQAG